ncbi:MAG TPA: carbon-nitrogen hydrolase family protein [Pilimelia sp.]|nr:carbon-nitrogen hydrolase family protein [Pilimelia sp.]
MTPLPSAPLRFAAAQAAAAPGRVARNARHAAALAARAAAAGAALVVLPELHLCGYDLAALAADGGAEVPADRAGRVHDERLRPLARLTGEAAVTVVVGAAVRRPDGRLTNSLVRVADGRCRVVYDKEHLWHGEDGLFTAGASGADIRVGTWRVGLGICYDMSFPEHARAAAARGAHLYAAASAFAAGAEHRAAVYLACRALENTVYSAFVNPVGGPAGRPSRGGSAVWAPDGRRLAAAGPDAARLLTADLDPAVIADTRRTLRMLAEHTATALPPRRAGRRTPAAPRA